MYSAEEHVIMTRKQTILSIAQLPEDILPGIRDERFWSWAARRMLSALGVLVRDNLTSKCFENYLLSLQIAFFFPHFFLIIKKTDRCFEKWKKEKKGIISETLLLT